MTLNLKDHIRGIPDFPKPGILFYDIGTLMVDGAVWQETIRQMTQLIQEEKPELIFAVESRGFLIASPIAAQLGVGLVMVRKKGKLPGETIGYSYDLEYGTDTLEVQKGIFAPGKRAIIMDDLIATGGTTKAALALARQTGSLITRIACVIELSFLKGRDKLDVPVSSLLTYDD